MAAKQGPALVATLAVQALGRGYDVTCDLRLKDCKGEPGSCLIELHDNRTQDLAVPGDILLPNVSASVKCDKGDRTRFRSDVLSFSEMSEHVNRSLSISSKTPLGPFNTMFSFLGQWQKDAAMTKTLAMDGVFINLYTVELLRTQLSLKEEVREAVPSAWDPASLASFVEKYGTHIIVGVKIGGKDVICLKQHQASTLSSMEVQKLLEADAEDRFPPFEGRASKEKVNKNKIQESSTLPPYAPSGLNGIPITAPYVKADSLSWNNDSSNSHAHEREGVTMLYKRKGGLNHSQSHNEWLYTVPETPDVISMSFVPITTLLNGVTGTGFLSHAINLYLRYKPSIQELRYFLEYQLPKEWAPAFGDLPLGPPRKQYGSPSLQFRLMGPKLQINTTPVIIGKRPVTGLRLYLEGKKSNRLAIHLQSLSVVPQILQPLWEEDHPGGQEEWAGPEADFSKYFEPVMWKSFSHVCTAPVENNETWVGGPGGAFVVVGAQLQVEQHGTKKVLFLKLLYSLISKARIRRSEWDHTPASQQKSGIFSTLMSTTFSSSQPQVKPAQVVINSAIYPEGPPVPGQMPKLLKLVDTTEMSRGPHDFPGHWLVTGAKLFLDGSKISLRAKYSLLLYSLDRECAGG